MRISGTTAVVTGASSGIGEAVAIELARRGARVLAVARREDRLKATLETMHGTSPSSSYEVADLSTRRECERVASAALERLGRVDILVNNAGISVRKLAAETPFDDIERVFAINFFAGVAMSNALLPQMISRGTGSIVNVCSVAAGVPNPRESAYCASKAALSAWTHVLAVELGGTGVHAGVIDPGPIATEIWSLDGEPSYKGKMYPPSVIGKAVAKMIERERVHVTTPRHFGLPRVLYPWMGRAMRPGLRKYDDRVQQRSRKP